MDGFQALFRPVAMMVPDYKMIAQVSLYANGYLSAASLATNLVSCLKVGAIHRPPFYFCCSFVHAQSHTRKYG